MYTTVTKANIANTTLYRRLAQDSGEFTLLSTLFKF
jgi:hypothetical protein